MSPHQRDQLVPEQPVVDAQVLIHEDHVEHPARGLQLRQRVLSADCLTDVPGGVCHVQALDEHLALGWAVLHHQDLGAGGAEDVGVAEAVSDVVADGVQGVGVGVLSRAGALASSANAGAWRGRHLAALLR